MIEELAGMERDRQAAFAAGSGGNGWNRPEVGPHISVAEAD
jgi:hypothetical protein